MQTFLKIISTVLLCGFGFLGYIGLLTSDKPMFMIALICAGSLVLVLPFLDDQT